MHATHTLADDATLAEAVTIFAARAHPLLALVDRSGKVSGVLTEEDVRIGLAGRSRPHHSVSTLARDVADCPGLPVDADGRPGPCHERRPAIERALIMAGGKGTRLRPLTETTPKPLLDVGGRPLLHAVLDQVASAGVSACWISVCYLADRVRESAGDGSAFGLAVEYVEETEPLGTAGALGLVPPGSGPLLVMNGDISSDVNLAALRAWHDRHGNRVTVATHLHEVDVPYGLAHFDGQRLERLEEKPTLRLPVNAGIYLFEPDILAELPRGAPRDMVDWLNELSARGVVGQFPIVERWHDIGSREEYDRLSRPIS